MAEVMVDVKTIKVDMICEMCGNGRMRPNGQVVTTLPPWYMHYCTDCGYGAEFPVQYPYFKYEEIEK